MPREEAAFLSSGDRGILLIYILAPTLLSLQSLDKSIRRPSLISIIEVASLINFFGFLASGMRCLLSNGSTIFQGKPNLESSVFRVRSLDLVIPPCPPLLKGGVGGFSRRTGLFIFFSNSSPHADSPRLPVT